MLDAGKCERSLYYDTLCAPARLSEWWGTWVLTPEGYRDCREYLECQTRPADLKPLPLPAPVRPPEIVPVGRPGETPAPGAGGVKCYADEPADVCARRIEDELIRQQRADTEARWQDYFASLDEQNRLEACNERGGRYEGGQCILPRSSSGLLWVAGALGAVVVLQAMAGGR